MTQPITMPLWAFVLIVLFAAVTFASHFLFPSVRWFFRKRAERVIARLNERLQRPIEPFKLARRYDMIQRLIYDPEVTQAIVDHARKNDVPESVAFEQAQRYAREIVPSFSATAYFSIGIRFARWLSKSLYRIRVDTFDAELMAHIDADATVIFVINHRSNMDYVLVTYLAGNAGALSYAVGEWARVWPLSSLIRAMGAYFIRRKSRGALYRKVLARYVQMATRGGVSQAVFPEGGLSLDGQLAPPKLGLLSYVLEDFDPERRDVIFVPVALNYDRVLEDTFLIAADQAGNRRFKPPFRNVARRVSAHLWQRLTRRFRNFGVASVSFGEPLTLSHFNPGGDGVDPDELGAELMLRIAAVVPVLDVPMVCRQLVGSREMDRATLVTAVTRDFEFLKARGLPNLYHSPEEAVDNALNRLMKRGQVTKTGAGYRVSEASHALIAYYARSIAHHFGAEIQTVTENAAVAE